MKAFVAHQYSKDPTQYIQEANISKPQAPQGHDILVRNYSIATNPVDVKKLANFGNIKADEKLEQPVIVGWDSAGVVEAVGAEATLFRVGDHVYFAGVLSRAGSFAEYTLVDERIVGHKPKSLSWDQAATVPLVALTAYEAIHEQLGVSPDHKEANAKKVLLMIAGAGGVGSIAIQLAKREFGLTVVATASRDETVSYCKELGADHVINHTQPLLPQLKQLGLNGVDYIFNTIDMVQNFSELASVLNVFGKIVDIVGPSGPIAIGAIMAKRATITYELMFTRGLFNVEPEVQNKILTRVAHLIDSGTIKHCMKERFDFTLDGVKKALALQASSKAMGKIAITVYQP